MIGFDNTMQTLISLQGYFNELKEILQESEKNPEILLTKPFLTYETDQNYILTNLTACFGMDGLNAFLDEYFNKIIQVLSRKIPIDEIEYSPSVQDGEYVLLCSVNGINRIVINTFSKTIQYIIDDTKNQYLKELALSRTFIANLEEQLEVISDKNSKAIVFNKKTHEKKLKTEISQVVAQLGLEKQNLAKLKEALEEYENDNLQLNDLLERYVSRLKTYYHFSVITSEDLEQHIPELK